MLVPIGPFRKVATGGGAGLPPYLPLSFDHLEEYYDTRLGLSGVANLGNVDPWPDYSGNGRNMVGTGTPAVPTMQRAAGLLTPKGVATVFWSILANSALGSGTIAYPTNARGMCFYSYAYRSATGAAVEWQDSTGGRPQLIWGTAGSIGWRDTLGTHAITPQAGNDARFRQLCWNFKTNGTCDLYANGTLKGSDSWSWTDQVNAATELGNNQVFAAPEDSLMAYFVWYSRAHTAAEIALHALWSDVYFGNQ